MQKRKKKKHVDNYIGRSVSWTHQGPMHSGAFSGIVEAQELVLRVKLPDGVTVRVNADIVTPNN